MFLRLFFSLCLLLSVVSIRADEWQTDRAYPMPSEQTVNAVEMEDQFEIAQMAGLRFTPSNTTNLTMFGESRITIPADYADLSISIEHVITNNSGLLTAQQGDVVRGVTERIATVTTRALELLRSEPNVTKIRTTNVDLSPVYNWTGGFQQLVGYRASNTLSFRVTLPSAPSVLAHVLGAGISRINSITYAAAPERITTARLQATQAAIADAQQQAQAVAKQIAPETAVIRVISVDMTTSSPAPVPLPFSLPEGAMARMALQTAMPIVGGELTVTARARVQFAIDTK